MSDNTIHLLRELLELVAGAADPDLVLAQVCVELRDRQTDQSHGTANAQAPDAVR